MKNVQYDPSIIQAFANHLYERAALIVGMFTLCSGLVGGVAGTAVIGGVVGFVVGAAVCGAIGYLLGQHFAFGLKLQAQIALCQVQVEANTRGAAAALVQLPVPRVAAHNSNAA